MNAIDSGEWGKAQREPARQGVTLRGASPAVASEVAGKISEALELQTKGKLNLAGIARLGQAAEGGVGRVDVCARDRQAGDGIDRHLKGGVETAV